jgi:hypothetical protein
MRGAFRPGLLSGLKQTSHFKRVTTVFDPKAVNLQIDIRWSGGNADGINKNAVELAALAPVVIVVQRWGRCFRRPAPYQSCLWSFLIRSVPVS